jgi:hypothetical protein
MKKIFKKKPQSKYILATGCSFTTVKWKSIHYPDYDTSYPKWPELLGNTLDADVVNIGRSGYSNDCIVNNAIDYILNADTKPWLVVVGLTEITRFNPWGAAPINVVAQAVMDLGIDQDDSGYRVYTYDDYNRSYANVGKYLLTEGWFNDSHLLPSMWNHYIKVVLRLINLCKKLNIKIILSQLVFPFTSMGPIGEYRDAIGLLRSDNDRKVISKFMLAEDFDAMPSDIFMGWPMYEEIGGTVLTNGFKGNDCVVGEDDGHPNRRGHEIISEHYYERYNKLYK